MKDLTAISSQAGNPAPEGRPPQGMNDQFQIMQSLMEIQGQLSTLNTKTERLITDRELDRTRHDVAFKELEKHVQSSLAGVTTEVKEAQRQITGFSALVKGGFAVGCVALFALWFLLGDDIHALINFARSLPRA